MKSPKISWGRIKLGRIGLFDYMFVKKDIINGLSISDEMTSGNVNLSKIIKKVPNCMCNAYDDSLIDNKRDSNLVDSASSIRLSQRLSHACLSINASIL